jgi:WD40 repeat protein/energy-coupling factor transporter ATP-binding protein EcfA2
LRALALVASPQGLKRYRLEPFEVNSAVSSVRAALGEIPCDVLGICDGAVGPPTLDALCERMTAEQYTLLHVVCHGQLLGGDGETVLYLAKANQQVDPVDGTRLLERLGRLRGARGLPHFAFLATCESASPEAEGALGGLAQRLVRELGMPAVVAMTEKVSVVTAQALWEGFYRRLREHGTADRALVEACAGLAERYDITVPALYSRLGGRPLFSDMLDRPLTNAEILSGLAPLEILVAKRAPVLQQECQEYIARLRGTLGVDPAELSEDVRQEREHAVAEINKLCGEALDLSFGALALGQEPPAYDDRCPFRGLYPFRVEDREFFFGRETLIEQLQQKLADHSFLAVLGPSGSGKSSVVLAGLIPALQAKEPGLQLAYLTPGGDPLAQLDASLAQGRDGHAVLVVDQFEELFTLCTNEAARQTFLERLMSLAQARRVVLTMRADFWGECAPYRRLKEAMQTHQELIAPMNAAELRRAMEMQAAKVGLRFEADLSNTILDGVQSEPGAMPLLQHALLELWKRRHGRWLRAGEYRAIGGVQQAIARTADEVYGKLPSDEQERVRDIFLRLTRLAENTVQSEDRRDTRRRVQLTELVPAASDPTVTKALLARLADSRLLVTYRNAVTHEDEAEVAHEALIRHWPRLRGWLDEDRASLRLREGIREAAREWDERGRDESLLVHRGSRLEDAEALATDPKFALNQLEREYVDACAALQEWENAAREEQRRRELEAAQQLAEERRQRLEESERLHNIAVARQLAAQAELTRTQRANLLQRSALLAIESMRRQPSPEAYHILSRALALLPRPLRRQTHESGNGEIVFSDDGRCLIFPGARRFTQGRAARTRFLLSPDARYVAAFSGAMVSILAADSGREISRVRLKWVPRKIAFSQDGQRLAAGFVDGSVSVWSATRGSGVVQLERGYGPVGVLAFSPDGAYVAAASGAHSMGPNIVSLWRTTGGPPIGSIPDGNPNVVAFSPTSQYLATACLGVQSSPDGVVVQVWRPSDRREPWRRIRKVWRVVSQEMLFHLAFSLDGQYLAAASRDDAGLMWDMASGKEVARLTHDGAVHYIAFSPQGTYVATASADKTARIWQMRSGHEVARAVHDAEVGRVAFNVSGAQMATMSGEETTQIWEAAGGRKPAMLIPKGDVAALIFTRGGEYLRSMVLPRGVSLGESDAGTRHEHVVLAPDGGYAVLASVGETSWVWEATADQADRWPELNANRTELHGALYWASTIAPDAAHASANRAEIARFVDHWRGCGKLALSRDDRYLATADGSFLETWLESVRDSARRCARVWDFVGGPAIAQLEHNAEVSVVAFSPNGDLLATADRDGNICLWQGSTWRMVRTLQHRSEVYAMLFSPDGRQLATVGNADNTHTVRLWDFHESQEIAVLEFDARVQDVALTADGQYLATAGADNIARVWETATRREVARISDEEFPDLHGVEFSTDGRFVARISARQREWERLAVTLWQWQPEDVLAEAYGHLTRNFTKVEWQQWLGDEEFRKTCPDLP